MNASIVHVSTAMLGQTRATEIDHDVYKIVADVTEGLKSHYADSPTPNVASNFEDDLADVATEYLMELGITPLNTTPENLARVEGLMRLIVMTTGMQVEA
ncbi:hypothetical protein GTE7_gp090 [Gordonia phage GTE7]|uniref:Uncharacterized protein n=1 Tax=Gordonia phage GTE7 TaxID=1100814 RepID=G8FS83_9CAUD|nr:hypothetical protein GTE7_gp090 [Gordonia phage GTE7]AER26633.1 hypothetical protein [Gordonia phage GTE7]